MNGFQTGSLKFFGARDSGKNDISIDQKLFSVFTTLLANLITHV